VIHLRGEEAPCVRCHLCWGRNFTKAHSTYTRKILPIPYAQFHDKGLHWWVQIQFENYETFCQISSVFMFFDRDLFILIVWVLLIFSSLCLKSLNVFQEELVCLEKHNVMDVQWSYPHYLLFEKIWCQSILGQSDCWSYQYRHCDSTHLHYLLKGLVLYSLMFQNGLVFNYDHNILRVPLEKEFQKQKMKNANKVEYYKHLSMKEGSLFCSYEIHQTRMLQIVFLVSLETLDEEGRIGLVP